MSTAYASIPQVCFADRLLNDVSFCPCRAHCPDSGLVHKGNEYRRARLGYLLQTLTKLFGCSMCALVVSVITRRGRVNTLLRHRSAPRVHHGGL
eukprot:6527972-Pyramimonas_sp.AAC.1